MFHLRKPAMILLIATALFMIEAVHGLTVTIPPSNVTVQAGQDATIPCVVANVALGEDVKWKLGNGTLVADKSTVTNTNKYRVDGTYNLTILKTDTSDTGAYICTAAANTLTGYLTVNAGHMAAYSTMLTVALVAGAVLTAKSH